MKFSLGLLKIPVSDIERSTKFYAQTMGWSLQFSSDEYGWAQFEAGDLSVALYKPGMGGGNRKPGGSLDFHLVVQNPDDLQKRLMLFDADLDAEIFVNDDGTRSLEFADPDGNEWKLMSDGSG